MKRTTSPRFRLILDGDCGCYDNRDHTARSPNWCLRPKNYRVFTTSDTFKKTLRGEASRTSLRGVFSTASLQRTPPKWEQGSLVFISSWIPILKRGDTSSVSPHKHNKSSVGAVFIDKTPIELPSLVILKTPIKLPKIGDIEDTTSTTTLHQNGSRQEQETHSSRTRQRRAKQGCISQPSTLQTRRGYGSQSSPLHGKRG